MDPLSKVVRVLAQTVDPRRCLLRSRIKTNSSGLSLAACASKSPRSEVSHRLSDFLVKMPSIAASWFDEFAADGSRSNWVSASTTHRHTSR